MVSFLQSPEWEEVQERMGRPTRRIRDVLVIRHDLHFGFHYLYAPRPTELSREFFQDAEAVAGKSGAIFLKVDPQDSPVESLVISHWSLVIGHAHSLQPPATILVDCRIGDAELLGAMHPKTRYNIRVAERHGVRVRQADLPPGKDDFEKFWQLLCKTAEREGFHPHPEKHYQILLNTATRHFSNQLFLAEFRGQTLAAAISNFYLPSKTATYLHGASSREHREVMAPHLLHWRIIQSAREHGFSYYDFGGIDEKHWPGVTRFKKGFGGKLITFPQFGDIVFRPRLYRLYRFQHILRH